MDSPLTSRARKPASPGGCWHARDRALARRVPGVLRPAALRARERQMLRNWLTGKVPLRPWQAHDLLDRAVARFQLADEPNLHWRAVKAKLTDDSNWAEMGFRLVLD